LESFYVTQGVITTRDKLSGPLFTCSAVLHTLPFNLTLSRSYKVLHRVFLVKRNGHITVFTSANDGPETAIIRHCYEGSAALWLLVLFPDECFFLKGFKAPISEANIAVMLKKTHFCK